MNNASCLIQEETISELKDLLADDFQLLITTYLNDVNTRLARLHRAVDADDSSAIRAEAHSMKGSAINIGAADLAALFARLECLSTEQELQHAPNLVREIESTFSQTATYLQNHL